MVCCNYAVHHIERLTGPRTQDLRQAAADDRKSLNALVISVLEEAADDIERRRRNYENWAELEAFVASLPEVSDPTPLIREDRER